MLCLCVSNCVFHRRFVLVFVGVFLAEFLVFALVYAAEAFRSCVSGVNDFTTAFFFSMQTGLMLTFGGPMTPDPTCNLLQCVVAVQAIFSKVLEFGILSICFCRFTSPVKCTHGLYIAKTLVLATNPDGMQVLSCRVANARKHHLLNCSVRLLVAIDDLEHGRGIRIHELGLSTSNSQSSLLWLPFVASHTIDASSPLANLDLESEDVAERIEFMVVAEGVVAATSLTVQRCCAFTLDDLSVNAAFDEMLSRDPSSGRVIVDFFKLSDIVFRCDSSSP